MSWRSDELGHRTAERSGWAAELRAADPDAVDETVDGAAEYAAATEPPVDRGTSGSDRQEIVDPTTVAGPRERDAEPVSPASVTESVSRMPAGEPVSHDPTPVADGAGNGTATEQSDRRCAFCADPITDDEALDEAGVTVPMDSGFEWVGGTSLHHKECLPEGEGRFLPWTANGVLGEEAPKSPGSASR